MPDMRGRHGNHAKGVRHPRYKEGIAHHQDGYIKIQVGVGHPLADPNGYAYLHHLVWVSAGFRRPGRNEDLHHKDEDKTNNRISNLELLTKSDHMKHHDELRGRDQYGRFPGKVNT